MKASYIAHKTSMCLAWLLSLSSFQRLTCRVRLTQKKLKTVMIKLVSAAGTGFFYLTRKNPLNITRKIVLRKHDPVVNRHVLFEEQKLRKK